jgi:hypothetical protein
MWEWSDSLAVLVCHKGKPLLLIRRALHSLQDLEAMIKAAALTRG